MFRRQPPRIDYFIVLGAERTTVRPAVFHTLSIMMPAARSARPVPERPLNGLGVASFSIRHGQQSIFPVGRGSRPAGANGHGKLRMHLLPLVEAVGVNAQ